MLGTQRRSRSATSYSWLRPLPFQDFSLASTLPLSTESCFSFASNKSRNARLAESIGDSRWHPFSVSGQLADRSPWSEQLAVDVGCRRYSVTCVSVWTASDS